MSDQATAKPTAGSHTPAGDANAARDGEDLVAAAAVFQDLEALRRQTADLQKERDEFRALLQRTQADFENYQKRTLREHQQELRYAHGKLARDLVPLLDNFERAVAAAQKAGETGPLVQGVAMIQGQFIDMLRRHGITPIEAVGQPFDPNTHHAVMQQPSEEVPPSTVLQVVEQGFMIHDRVLRPASVVVSVAKQ
jgi:molecular chaperone GrpE